jgi:MFS transporter, PAT family, beta-lactamase induction signal transducer AmpG
MVEAAVYGSARRASVLDTALAVTRRISPPFYVFLSLATGLGAGFVGVTLAYVMVQHGMNVGQVALVMGVAVLPTTLRFLAAAVVDRALSPRVWYAFGLAGALVSFGGLAFAPLRAADLPLIAGLVFLMGMANQFREAGLGVLLDRASRNDESAPIGGWLQVGTLAGFGLGGGAGLWLASNGGGLIVAVAALIVVSLAASSPLAFYRPPVGRAASVKDARTLPVWPEIWSFMRTRTGALLIVALAIPACEGGSASLFPAIAMDWHASANLVAEVTGVLFCAVVLPGTVLGGYLSQTLPSKLIYLLAGVGLASVQMALALSPRWPSLFAVFVVAAALIQSVAWGAMSWIIIEPLKPGTQDSVGAVLWSLSNVPLVVAICVFGCVQTAHGTTAMLLAEAGVSLVAIVGFGLVSLLWRPTRTA